MKIWKASMADLPADQPLKISTYGGWTPSSLLERVDKAELLVGFFSDADTTLVFASIASNKYPHIKVRRSFANHAKYCLARDWAYIGSSNLDTTRTEVGIIVEDKKILRELREIHRSLWQVAVPHKPSNTKVISVSKLRGLLEAAL